MENQQKKKIVFDMALNITASMVPVAVLQLVIFPLFATRLGDDRYGLLLTIVSLMTLCTGTFGNSLNNVRLLMQLKYSEQKLSGDFNVILLCLAILNCIVMGIGTYLYEGAFYPLSVALILLSSVLQLVREYYNVEFRLNLNYIAVLVNNILLVAGYIIGCGLFLLTDQWQFIYITGTAFSLLHILKKTTLHREPFKTTALFRETGIKSLVLMVSSFLANAINYMDRLLLFPLVGGASVAIYYSATLFGKIISMGITPINSVMLSYFSKMKTFRQKNFWLVLGASFALGAVGYGACILISRPVLMLLYPQLAEQAMQYIFVTTATAMLSMVVSVLNPIILRFCNTNWQIGINGANVLLYTVLSLLLLKQYGLMGFCVGALLAVCAKLLLMIGIYCFSLKSSDGLI